MKKRKIFKFKDSQFELGDKTLIMGILNVTPDSFSDGNKYYSIDKAVDRALQMLDQGADIIDIGGESTRPGALAVSPADEINRVIPVVKKLKQSTRKCVLSVDTTKYEVAEKALEAGADIINDISGLQADPKIAKIVAKYNAGLILMHTKGTPANMMNLDTYSDLLLEIKTFLNSATKKAQEYGLSKDNIMLDPGIGFAKNHLQNIEIIKKISVIQELNYPLLIGPSRKSFIGQILNKPNPETRIFGTAAVVAWLSIHNVDCVRVHDITEMKEVITIIESIRKIE